MKKIPVCSPEKMSNLTKEVKIIGKLNCSFSGLDLYTIEELKKFHMKLYKEMINNLNLKNNQVIDFINECPIFILKKGTKIIHTTRLRVLKENNQDKYSFEVLDTTGWWKKYFPGQKKYKGGWFTYETTLGGPNFNSKLIYTVTKDVPILYIPNYYYQEALKCSKSEKSDYFDCDYLLKNNQRKNELFEKYESNTINQKEENELKKLINDDEINTFQHIKYETIGWKSSHVIPGVRNWKKKGYPIIKHDSQNKFADDLALRLANLGFFGYISCDECELYLTHKIMEKCLSHPDFQFNPVSDDLNALDKYYLLKVIDSIKEEPLRVTPIESRNESENFIKHYTFENILTRGVIEDFIKEAKGDEKLILYKLRKLIKFIDKEERLQDKLTKDTSNKKVEEEDENYLLLMELKNLIKINEERKRKEEIKEKERIQKISLIKQKEEEERENEILSKLFPSVPK
jgi:hypothetical protein